MKAEQWQRFYDQLSAAGKRLDAIPANKVEAYLADIRAAAESRLRAQAACGQYALPYEADPLDTLVQIGLELVAARGPFGEAVVLEMAVEQVVLYEIAYELENVQLEELARIYPAEIAEREPGYLPDGEESGVDLYERNLREILEERILLAAAAIAFARDARENA